MKKLLFFSLCVILAMLNACQKETVTTDDLTASAYTGSVSDRGDSLGHHHHHFPGGDSLGLDSLGHHHGHHGHGLDSLELDSLGHHHHHGLDSLGLDSLGHHNHHQPHDSLGVHPPIDTTGGPHGGGHPGGHGHHGGGH